MLQSVAVVAVVKLFQFDYICGMEYKEKVFFHTLSWDLGPKKCPVCGNYDCWDH